MSRHRRLPFLLSFAMLVAVAVVIVANFAADRSGADPALPTAGASGFPLRFESAGVRAPYAADALGGRIALEGARVVGSDAHGGESWSIGFVDGAAAPSVAPEQPSSGPTRTLAGAAPSYRSVRSAALYDGIGLSVTGSTDRVLLRLDVAAGAEAGRAAFRIEGATARLAGDGSVRWAAGGAELALFPPVATQIVGGEEVARAASFTMRADGAVALSVGGADPSLPLEADLVLVATTLRPAALAGAGMRVALDADGAAYVAGTVPARSGDPADGGDGFVAKLDRDGGDFAWVVDLGGEDNDTLQAIGVGPDGRIAVAGTSGGDALVAELSPDGSILWSRRVGGAGSDEARAIAVDQAGRVWIAGVTDSPDLTVSSGAAQPASAGGRDAMVARFAPDGSIEYLSYLGGAGDDAAAGIVLSGTGVVVAGTTRSAGLDASAETAPGGGSDGFVTFLGGDGAITRTTYVGNTGDEEIRGVAIDREGRVTVAGVIDGADLAASMRHVGPLGGRDAFVARLSADGSRVESSTRLGGTGDDDLSAIALDHAGRLLLAGTAAGGFPTYGDPRRATPHGGADAFVATLDADAATLLHSGFVGGSSGDGASGVAVDGNGRVWLTGVSTSADLDGARPADTASSGGDGFVATIDDRPAPAQPSGSCPGTKQFDGGPTGTGTAWGTAANWSGDTLPAAGDDVCIDGFTVVFSTGAQTVNSLHVQGAGSLTLTGGSMTIAAASEIVSPATLSIAGGTLAGAGNLSIDTTLTWSNGSMGGTGVTTTNGGIDLGGGYSTLTRTLNNASGSTATFSGAAYSLTITSPGVFNNQAGATFDMQSDATVGGTGTFNNAGTFLRTTGTGTALVNAPFNNTGTVDVQSGRLNLNNNGTHTGDFDATGAVLEIGAGTHTFSSTSDITGTEVDFTGSTATLSGSYNVTGETKVTSGAANFTGATLNLISVGTTLTVAGGTATFSSGETLTPTTVNLTGGALTGSDNLTIGGLLTWSNATMAGTGVTTTNGNIALGGGYSTLTRTLNNASGSTATFSGPAYSLTVNTPGVFNNQAGATYDEQSDATIGGTGLFSNAGTFLRTSGAGSAVINVPFNNTGTVDVQTGRLVLNSNGTHTGDFDATGAILEIGAGTQTFSATSDITGTEVDFTGATATLSGSYNVTGETLINSGAANFTGATLNLVSVGSTLTISGGTATFSSGEAVTPPTVNLTGGTLTGSDAVTIGGLLTWSSGSMTGTGVTTTNGGIAFGGGYSTLTRTLNNASGSAAVFSGIAYALTINAPGVFNNQAGASFDQQCDASINGNGVFNNAGSFLRTTSSGSATVNATFNNTGTVDVQSGRLVLNGSGAHTGDFDCTGAILEIGGGTHTFSATSDVTGTEIDFTGANATFAGSYNVTGETRVTSGNVNFTGATLNLVSVGSNLTVTAGTTTFSSGETVTPTTVDFSGGTISGSDAINISGLLTWSNGTMSGAGVTTTSGGIAFGGGYSTLTRTLNNASGSTAVFSGLAYALTINSPGVFNNQAGATFDQQCDASIGGTGIFNNAGTFLRTTSSGEADVSVDFNNTGSVDIQSGELRLSGDGTDTGDYDCTGALLSFTFSGVRTMSTATAMTGTEVDILGGTITFGGTWNVTTKTLVTNGTITFTSQATITSVGSDLEVDNGTLTSNSGETISPTTLELKGGTISGSDNFTIPGLLTWEGGTFSGSGTTTANGGMALTTNGSKVVQRNVVNGSGSTAVNSGLGSISIASPSVLTNAVGGIWDEQNDGQFNGTGTFSNQGTFNRTTSSGEVFMLTKFDNSGALDVQTGTFHPNSGGTWSGSADCTGAKIMFGAGTFTLTNTSTMTGTEVEFANCTLSEAGAYNVATITRFTGCDATFTGPSTITSFGSTLQIAGGTATFNSGEALSVANLDFTNGTLNGSDNVTVTGPFAWKGGQMSGSGTTTAQAGLTIDTNYVALGRALVNASGSTAVISGVGGMFFNTGSSITNEAGATFDVQNDSGFSNPGTSSITNAGTWLRTTSSGTFYVDTPFINTGTFEARSGDSQFTNYTQNAGTTRLNGGTITAFSGDVLTIAGGVLTGNGTINGAVSVTGGSVAPGSSAGTIAVTGFQGGVGFGAGGAYACEIGGTTQGTQYDLLGGPTSGTFNVGGTLNVSLINGFVPSIGNSFTIVQGSSVTGTFATLSLPPLSGGNVWFVTYTATTVVLTVAPPTNADIAVTNTDAPDPVNAGANVTYTITVTNNGPDPATNVQLSNPLPSGTSFVSATPSQGTCSNSSGVTCPLGNIANGATATITIVVTTSGASVPSITDTATASATEADLTPGNNSAAATTTVNPVADLSIVKNDTPDPVAAAGALTYTLDVTNSGPNVANSLITVTDNLPGTVSLISATGTGWSCGNVGNNVTCTRPSLAITTAPSIVISVVAPSSPNPSLGNTASVSCGIFDPVSSNNSSSVTTAVTAVADLTITKGDAPDPVNAGAALTYTLDVSNAGPSTANSLTVLDTLPAGVTFVSATGTGWACVNAPGTVTCTRASLAVGAAPTITITVTAPAEGNPSLTNTATVTATEFDPTTPNTATATTVVTARADLSIVKSDSPDPVNTGSTLTYTLAVSNAGPSTATNVSVTDTLNPALALVSATGTGWTCGNVGQVVTCTRPTLAVGAAPAITITVTTPATPQSIDNTATVSATEADPSAANNSSTTSTEIHLLTAELSITKTDAPDPVNAGAALAYTLNVSNAGPDPANNVVVTDTLDAAVSFVSASGTGWACGHVGQVVTCARPTLAVGAAPAITIAVTAPSEGGTLANAATVAADEADGTPANNTANASTTVTAVANLAIVKTDSPDPVAAGGTLTYTIDVSNAGPSTATNVSVSDAIVGSTFVSAAGTGWTCGNAAGTVTCTRPTLAPGAAPSITITVTAPGTPGPLSNTATVAATENDPVASNNSSTATTNVTAVADLSIAKGDAPDPVNAGAALTYTLNVSNAGPSAASNVSVSDPLPNGVTFVSATGTGWACVNPAGTVTCTRASLAVGAAPAITITVTAPAEGNPSLSNTATVSAAEFDPTTPNTATATTVVTPRADLSITKTDSPDPVNTSSTLTYTITVTNNGPSTANTLTMTDALNPALTFVSASGTGWACANAAGTVTCTRPTLAPGAAPAITITVTSPATSQIVSNTATIAAASPADPTPGNNSATSTTSVAVVTADLSITKGDAPDPVNSGATLTYTLNVSNAGPDPATSVSVVDTLPAGVAFVSFSGSGWGCGVVSSTVTCTRTSLAVGAAPALILTVTAPAEGNPALVNSATVSGAEADSNPANNTATATTVVTARADLAIVKTDSPDPVQAGGTLTYTLAVSNLGPSTAANVAVTDVLTGVTFVSATGTGWTCGNASGTVTCTMPTLAPGGGAAPITLTVTAPANGGSINNTASVASATADPVATNNADTEGTTVTAVNDLSIVKTASSPTVAAGATFSYTLTVTNAGPSTAGTVTVTDPIPSGVVYQSASGTGWSCTQASGTVTCMRSSLAVGAAPAITINVRAPNSAASPNNTATVATSNDPNAANNSSSAAVTVTASADLRLTKTASAPTVSDGSTVTYTLSVRNLGPSIATNVVVSDVLPFEATFVSAGGTGWSCTPSRVGGFSVVCTRTTLGVGTAPAIAIVVTIDTDGEGGTVCNSASVASDATDPVPADDTSQACVNVVPAGTCSSLQDLLAQVGAADIPPGRQSLWEKSLQTTINASSLGQSAVVAQRLALFTKQVRAAQAQRVIDAATADSLATCAEILRQQAIGGAGRKRK